MNEYIRCATLLCGSKAPWERLPRGKHLGPTRCCSTCFRRNQHHKDERGWEKLSVPNKESIIHERLVCRIEQRDRKIIGLERKIQRLEEALSWRTIDLESLTKNIKGAVQYALCNVRMIPVFGGSRDKVLTEVINTPTQNKKDL